MNKAKRLALEILQKAGISPSIANLVRIETILKGSKPLIIKRIKARKK